MPAIKYFTSTHDAGRAKLASDLVMAGDTGFMMGMLPLDLKNEKAALPESVEAQVLRVLGNMETVLASHGMSRSNVVSVAIHVTEFKRFYERVNEAYAGYFDAAKLPARSIAGVERLPRSAMVSLDFVVHKA